MPSPESTSFQKSDKGQEQPGVNRDQPGGIWPQQNKGREQSKPDNLRVLFLSTAVSPLGKGDGGGVELSVQSLARSLSDRGHSIDILAPEGSRIEGAMQQQLLTVGGALQPKAQHTPRGYIPLDPGPDTALYLMCRLAEEQQARYDLILNFSYDLLPLQMTSKLATPLVHLISMGSLYDRFDQEIEQIANQYPGRLACYSHSQARSFSVTNAFRVLGFGLDLSNYIWRAEPEEYLLWMGRISPEKGLEDALEVCKESGIPLRIAGKREERAYWEELAARYQGAPFHYEGFLPTASLQKLIGGARALLMTPKWDEAFGIVAVESLACGTPVISYQRGGPAEIIEDGKQGWLTPPDRPDKLLQSVKKLNLIDRKECRNRAEAHYSLSAWARRMEEWFASIVRNRNT
ncbi:MAG: glycosyltransferase family 4 protein [Balneolaceae bacterium]